MIIYVSISPSNCCDRLPIPLVISCGKTTVTSHPDAGGFVPSAHVFIENQICARLQDSCTNKDAVADLGKAPLFWVKKEEMTAWRKASRASKSKLTLLLRSRSGSATSIGNQMVTSEIRK